METSNDMVTAIRNRHTKVCKTVMAESIEAFFDDVTPMLGRLSHLEEDGQILVPHTPQFMAHVHQKEERHRPMFDVEIVEQETFVEKGHKKWLNWMNGLTEEETP